MDVIARTAFGLELNTQKEKDNPFVKMAHKLLKPNNILAMVLCKYFSFTYEFEPVRSLQHGIMCFQSALK